MRWFYKYNIINLAEVEGFFKNNKTVFLCVVLPCIVSPVNLKKTVNSMENIILSAYNVIYMLVKYQKLKHNFSFYNSYVKA